jgi:glycerol uptake facilitator-like aquaporin
MAQAQPEWKPLLAEVIGTFTLIFAGAGAIIANQITHGGVGVLGIALAHGLAIGVMVSALGVISGGHFNPAVTCGFLVAGRIPAARAIAYVAAQLAGATLGGLALWAAYPHGTAVHPGAPRIGGLAIGLTITMDILAFGALTGAAMNPARAFGPALVSGVWTNQLVYWIGPLIGGALAGGLYGGAYLPAPDSK